RGDGHMATIASLMKTQLVTVSPTDAVALAARRMAETGVGALMVVEDGALVGLCSERDVVERVVAVGKDPATTIDGEVATKVLETVAPDTRLRRCAEILREGGFRHLPVVDGGRPVGILSARDFFEHVVGTLEQLVDQKQYQDKLGEGVDPYDHPGGSYTR